MTRDELVASERANFSWPQFRLGLAQLYANSGGTIANARKIWQLTIREAVEYRLSKKDLPGPDEMFKPYILDAVEEGAGESFDEFFQVRGS